MKFSTCTWSIIATLSSVPLLPADLWHFSMSHIRVILQVRGRDGMSSLSKPHSDAVAY